MKIELNKTPHDSLLEIVKPYVFDDIWHTDPSKFRPDFAFLADRCCSIKSNYYVKLKGTWYQRTKQAAVADLFSYYQGFQTLKGVDYDITLQTIGAFLKCAVPSMDNTTYAPLMPDYVVFNGEKRLNLYVDNRMIGDDDDIEDATELMAVIRNSLCGEKEEASLPEMLREIADGGDTEFRWFMHWLAFRVQNPGANCQTNVWFMGGRGTGKGTTVKALKAISGSMGKADTADVERNWFDSIAYHDFIEWDEFKGNGWYNFLDTIKRITANSTLNVTSRHVGAVLQPAVSSNMFTTNNEHPLKIEKDDRQNTLIKTLDDDAWKVRAKALNMNLTEKQKNKMYSGMAAILHSIDVDEEFIQRPLMTATRATQVKFHNVNIMEEWLKELMEGTYVLGDDHPKMVHLHTSYMQYAKAHYPKVQSLDIGSFTDQLLADENVAKRHVTTVNGKAVRYIRIANIPKQRNRNPFYETADTVMDLASNDQPSLTGKAIMAKLKGGQ